MTISVTTRQIPPIGFVDVYSINHSCITKNIESPQKLGNNESLTSFIDLSDRFRGDSWVTPNHLEEFRRVAPVNTYI